MSSPNVSDVIARMEDWMETNCPSSKHVYLPLLNQFLTEPAHINWSEWKHLSADIQRDLSHLPNPGPDELRQLLSRLVVLRLNGGLGTTMGCAGPKSFIHVREGLSFLEVALRQHERVEKVTGVKIPLLLMNSFNTDSATKEYVGDRATSFVQSKCPRIDAETLMPLPDEEEEHRWYPPGHGNVFIALQESGLLEKLLAEGRDILFISNIDNTGAEPDMQMLKMMVDEHVDYTMECTEKTPVDLKGGTLIDIKGVPMHLEMPQVPPENIDDFCSTKIFKMFNTNNIWVNLNAVKDQVYSLKSEIIVNKKAAAGVRVPRSRFIPVKSCADLLAVCSDLYTLDDSYCLRLNVPPPPPTIKLSSHFQTVNEINSRFLCIPSLLSLRSLELDGDFYFKGESTFEGDVILSCTFPQHIPNGAIFRDETKTFP